jgi:hypothetical protein
MGKVSRWVTDPKAGAYCTITLDSGEKILVSHDKGGFKGGRLTIERLKFLGFSSDHIFTCDLDSQDEQEAQARGGHREEIDRDQVADMIGEKSSPSLG